MSNRSSPAAAPERPAVPERLVCFAHGKESGPWGLKIRRLAQVAQARGFQVNSPDYSHTHDPAARVEQLLALAPRAACLILAGSSMGGYVSAMACRALRPQALFLMAPALYFPSWDAEPEAIPDLCSVVHGWRDTIVPVERALRFANRHRADLLLVDDDHGLAARLDSVAQAFDALLLRALQATDAAR